MPTVGKKLRLDCIRLPARCARYPLELIIRPGASSLFLHNLLQLQTLRLCLSKEVIKVLLAELLRELQECMFDRIVGLGGVQDVVGAQG